MFLGELTSYIIEKLSETFKDDNCFNQCSDVNHRRFESTVLTLGNTWLSGKQPDKVKIVPPYKKVDLQWCPQKMRKTKKKQNKKQNLMTHPTLEEKTKIEEVG